MLHKTHCCEWVCSNILYFVTYKKFYCKIVFNRLWLHTTRMTLVSAFHSEDIYCRIECLAFGVYEKFEIWIRLSNKVNSDSTVRSFCTEMHATMYESIPLYYSITENQKWLQSCREKSIIRFIEFRNVRVIRNWSVVWLFTNNISDKSCSCVIEFLFHIQLRSRCANDTKLFKVDITVNPQTIGTISYFILSLTMNRLYTSRKKNSSFNDIIVNQKLLF